MPFPQTHSPAPHFAALTQSGQKVSLSDFKGKRNVVLYFYPKDDTPGCTVEACGFRDMSKEFEKLNTVILGVSPDGAKSHVQFISKFKLPFDLLCDEDKKISVDYGVWQGKSMFGHKYMGVARTTFVIDKEGQLVKIFEKVKPDGHNREVLEYLQSIV